ncbi:hypothetical protein HDU98_007695 [Podochytrium sp. JEL0797]|nr:hypothetical protein HDU98_007695 [Podochytrium sp. JEL0797]
MPIANPAPLGFCAFALTTFVGGLYNLNVQGIQSPNVIVGLTLAYGGLAQLLAGMWEFATGNTFGATAFTSYGAFWISYGYIFVPSSGILAAYATREELHSALGIYLLGWSFFTALMLLACLKSNRVLVALFAALLVAFVLLASAFLIFSVNSDATKTLTKTAGGIMVFGACLAWYLAASHLVTKETSYFELPRFEIQPVLHKDVESGADGSEFKRAE